MCGRVGDSPLVGSGAYANQQAGAVCTGHGESLLKVLLCRDVVYNVENGMTPHDACRKVINKMAELTGGHGGGHLLGQVWKYWTGIQYKKDGVGICYT